MNNTLKKYFSFLISHFSFSKGFSLIEVLVIVGMFSVLAGAILFTINPGEQMKKSNDGKRKTELSRVQQALELYYHDQGSYPSSTADYKISVNSQTINWGDPWQPYINKLPADPLMGNRYVYFSPASSNGQTYYIYANLERGSKDPQACNQGNACSSITSGGAGFPAQNACGKICNYGISSSNVTP